MYENILLPVDGSEGAAGILYHAAEITQWSDATIQILWKPRHRGLRILSDVLNTEPLSRRFSIMSI